MDLDNLNISFGNHIFVIELFDDKNEFDLLLNIASMQFKDYVSTFRAFPTKKDAFTTDEIDCDIYSILVLAINPLKNEVQIVITFDVEGFS